MVGAVRDDTVFCSGFGVFNEMEERLEEFEGTSRKSVPLTEFCLSVCLYNPVASCPPHAIPNFANTRTTVSVYVKSDIARTTALFCSLPRAQIAKIYQKENCTRQMFAVNTLFLKAFCSRDSQTEVTSLPVTLTVSGFIFNEPYRLPS